MGKIRSSKLSAIQHAQQIRLPIEFHDQAPMIIHELRNDAMAHFHTHGLENRGEVDPTQWKVIKEKHEMTVYKSLSCIESIPTVMAMGGIPGTLDDVLYGMVNPTPTTMHMENTIAHSDLRDVRLLAMLTEPTPSMPFETVTLKWVLRHHSGMVHQTDYVYLEATGILSSPEGMNTERVGYRVVSSVSLAAVPEFRTSSKIVRGHLSYCYLFRPRRQHGLDVFYIGRLDPKGGSKPRAALSLAAEMVLSSTSICLNLTLMKKLQYSLRMVEENKHQHSSGSECLDNQQSHHSSGRSRTRSFSHNRIFRRFQGPTASDGGSGYCGVCRRRIGTFTVQTSCQLCTETICTRCRVIKEVFSTYLRSEKLELCLDCLSTTNELNATWVAAQSLEPLESYFYPSSRNRSDESSMYMHKLDRKGSCSESEGGRPTMSTTNSSRASSLFIESFHHSRSNNQMDHDVRSFTGHLLSKSYDSVKDRTIVWENYDVYDFPMMDTMMEDEHHAADELVIQTLL